MLLAAAVMVAAQLCYRGWLVFDSWFRHDDMAFISRVTSQPFGWEMLLESHNSHLMPAGFLLTWLNTELAPWEYWPFAAEMVAMQLIASIGAVVFLISAFGRRPGILPPLAIYLFTVFTHSANLWWAVGVNQLPTIAVLFWGGWTHLRYLRTRRLRWAVATMLLTLGALAFQERALLLFLVYGFIALAYFASGDVLERTKHVVGTYFTGVVMYGAIGIGYAVLYVSTALQFDPGSSQDQPLMPLLTEMGGYGVASGLVGGPLRWEFGGPALGSPMPSQFFVWGSVALIAYLGYHLASTRHASKRSWWLFGIVLGVQIVLVGASRSFIVGPQIGRAYRYTTEMAPVAALTLALAVLPLIGATEVVRRKRDSAFHDRPWRVAGATAVVAVLGTYSSVAYAEHWNDLDFPKNYVANARADLLDADESIPLADAPVADGVFPGFALSYPLNMTSRFLSSWSDRFHFPTTANDRLNIVSSTGEVKPVLINDVRRAEPTDNGKCPYPVKNGRVVVPLDGPVMDFRWWVRITYYSQTAGGLTITAGDLEHETDALTGLHSLFFTAHGDGLDEIVFETEDRGHDLCISELELGIPYAAGDEAPR